MRTPLRCAGSQPRAYLQRNRHIDGANHRLEDAPNQGLVLQQRRARHHIAYFFGRTTHINIDDLRAPVDVEPRGLRHHLRVGAGDLHRSRLYLSFVIRTTQCFFATPQQRVRRNHL